MGFIDITDVRDGLSPSLRQTFAILKNTLQNNTYKNSSVALKPVSETLRVNIDTVYHSLIDTTYQRCDFPIIDGHGIFGFPPAYHEFTEIRFSEILKELFCNNENFNTPLPIPIPYSLSGGTLGYAESITKIPAHNLGEVIDATAALIKDPDITTKELLQFIKGPDLLIGGKIENSADLHEIYESGSGTVKVAVNRQNINRHFIGNVRDYCRWYNIKSRKLPFEDTIRISVLYNAYMNTGTECRLMPLKEILQGFIDNYRHFNQDISDEEFISRLCNYKKLSSARKTKASSD